MLVMFEYVLANKKKTYPTLDEVLSIFVENTGLQVQIIKTFSSSYKLLLPVSSESIFLKIDANELRIEKGEPGFGYLFYSFIYQAFALTNQLGGGTAFLPIIRNTGECVLSPNNAEEIFDFFGLDPYFVTWAKQPYEVAKTMEGFIC
ncbi:hypothetical protein [Xanthocytophaga agilis]|uniref:Uncharacterized protein n=1 Tax=Xanthocytophaga agilis TaxID=3048010 RepID=A0AAE3UCK8_9BACT|nr:hypothetical protein [Xanthocytophaga agilis]MDJ1499486.1 hypothetical protein [Xanthocytophaga agilis]